MRKFWESKKWLAFGSAVVIGLATYVLNTKYGLGVDANALMAMIGLSGLYVLVQGRIDTKKGDQTVAKAYLDSHKSMALLVGQLIPLLVGVLNAKVGVAIPPELVLSLIGVDAAYLVVKGSADGKEAAKH